MRVEVRQATLRDLDALARLFDGYRQFYAQAADPPQARAFLEERLRRGESLILLGYDELGVASGFIQLYPLFSSVRLVRTWLLNDLFVASNARRQGVAAALLQAAVKKARALGAASLSLSTALDNAPAQALYESLGWQRDRRFCEYSLML
jgi:ribosomal protein S18 acetylase RimI-like enzyme